MATSTAPEYIQDGLQTEEQLGSMLSLQLDVVWPLELPTLEPLLLPRPAIAAGTPSPPLKVLDVGCGQGAWAARVAERFEGTMVMGVDLEEGNIAAARRAAAASPAASRLEFGVANAYALCGAGAGIEDGGDAAGVGGGAVASAATTTTTTIVPGTFDVAACRSMLYTVPHPGAVVAQLLQALRPEGGVAHFFCEDYGAVHARPTRADDARFWRDGPCTALRSQQCEPHMGRSIHGIATDAARALGLRARVSVTHVPICSVPGACTPAAEEARTRETMARVFETWQDYAPFIAENSGIGEVEARAHFADISAACRDPAGYVLWLCTVCEVRLDGYIDD